jgi:hypothetical protein
MFTLKLSSEYPVRIDLNQKEIKLIIEALERTSVTDTHAATLYYRLKEVLAIMKKGGSS